MPGPARAGALIYAKELQLLSQFYQQLLGMKLLNASTDMHVLESADFQLLIHAIPPHIASTFEISVPPEPREETAIKLFFTVASLQQAAALSATLGGRMMDQAWNGPGFTVRNALDPEGNIFQLREWTAR